MKLDIDIILRGLLTFLIITTTIFFIRIIVQDIGEIEEEPEVITCVDETYTHMGRSQTFRVCVRDDESFTIESTSPVNEEFYREQLSSMKSHLLTKL